MKKTLVTLLTVSLALAGALGPTTVSAKEFDNGFTKVSFDMKRVFKPVLSCSQYRFEFKNVPGVNQVQIRLLNAYYDEVASKFIFGETSGVTNLQLCFNKDLTRPLTLQIESTEAFPGSQTAFKEFRFKLKNRPKANKRD